MTARILPNVPGFVQRARILWQNPLVEFFSMRRRLAAAREVGFGPSTPGFAESQLAFSILRDAHQIGNSPMGHEAALILYRAATRLMIDAELRRNGALADSPEAELWDQARQLGIVREPLSLERALSAQQGEAYLAELAPAERGKMLEELRAVAQGLADRSFDDATRLARTLWTRRFRIGGLALLLIGPLTWFGWGVVNPRNLALHQPVEVSDREPTYGVDPSQVVDGDELNLGFHTGNKKSAWVSVDLGEVRRVKRVVVYNRIDCCQERAVPLEVELSNDGREFTSVATREHRFQEWNVSLPSGSRARFVRLHHKAPGAFHLAEIKVF
ncbi:MAG TPA: discoidin domain-containing protein [Polyangiaceae bacterium]|nr:discoidin domain-containing protein [Polyangiaceae bacterium]